MTITQRDVELACKAITDYPITRWRANPDGTITAINSIGQKFIVTPIDLTTADPDTPTRTKRRK